MSKSTHRFRNPETMDRAKEWLGTIGIPSDQIEVSSTGLPTLTITTDFARIAEVDQILNAVELTDPQGWPSLDTMIVPPYSVITTQPDAQPATEAHTSPIGWHPTD